MKEGLNNTILIIINNMSLSSLFRDLNNIILETRKDKSDEEGHIAQAPYFCSILTETIRLLSLSHAPRVLQIGFNAGHSTLAMLKLCPNIEIVSVDLGEHGYTKTCNEYISKLFPGQHTLIIGNSLEVLPKLTDQIFDIFFIDGGHEYEIAFKDLENCYVIAQQGGAKCVILDDVIRFLPEEQIISDAPYTIGPTKAWTEFLSKNIIFHLGQFEHRNRGMATGLFN